MSVNQGMPLADRFWLKVRKTDDCWLWTGCRYSTGMGYGRIAQGAKTITTHRASWIINYGQIEDGLCVLHRCDVPLCVRPDHLFLGTHADNIADCVAKGRRRWNCGEAHHSTKMTGALVAELRREKAAGASWNQLVARYGVNKGTLRDAVDGHTWKHIPMEHK